MGRRGDPPRRRLVQGEPPRLRPRGARAGLSAVCFDQRGHGDSGGELDGRALDDVATVAALLGDVPLATRGSSMGGYLAILAAEQLGARAAVAICPASADGLCARAARRRARLPRRRRLARARSWPSTRWTPRRAARAAAAAPARRGRRARPGRALARAGAARARPRSELVVVPGGHHRSVQHDAELQGHALRWLRQRHGLRPSPPPLGPEGVGRAGVGDGAPRPGGRGAAGRCSALLERPARPTLANRGQLRPRRRRAALPRTRRA